MENLTNIPGFQHIAQEIFLNLDNESLVNCFKVNRLWKNILNSSFWMKKCKMYKPKEAILGEFAPDFEDVLDLLLLGGEWAFNLALKFLTNNEMSSLCHPVFVSPNSVSK